MKFALIGRTEYLYDAAKLLLQNGHELTFVATCKAAPEYKRTQEDFAFLAEQQGAVFVNGLHLEENMDRIRKSGAEIAISMNWVQVLKESIISLFPFGILNAHPGALPRYRGNACPNWAILNGEETCGITIHKMMPGELDSGDIVLQKLLPICAETTVGEIYDQLAVLIPEMFLKAVQGLSAGTISPVPQSKKVDDALRVYPRLPMDGFIDWNAKALDIVRLIHASSEPFSGAYTYWNNEKLVIWDAVYEPYALPSCAAGGQITSLNHSTGTVSFAAKEGVVTVKEISYGEYYHVAPTCVMKSLRIRLGMDVYDEIVRLKHSVMCLEQTLKRLESEHCI